MNKVNEITKLQAKQQELDDYILKSKGILIFKDGWEELTNRLTPSELTKNMWLAGYSELLEIKESLHDAEEWVDLLHFILSIANKEDIELDDTTEHMHLTPSVNCDHDELWEIVFKYYTLALDASACYKHWKNVASSKESIQHCFEICIEMIYEAVYHLGLSMFDEYEKKYIINKQRQKENY